MIEPEDSIHGRLEALERDVRAIKADVSENTKATLEGNRDAREILELFQAVRGGFRVLGWLGTAAKWITTMGAFAAAAYAWWHSITGGAGKP